MKALGGWASSQSSVRLRLERIADSTSTSHPGPITFIVTWVPRRPMISWVFFDLGGTLLDDSELHDFLCRTYVDLLAEHGHRVSIKEFTELRDLLIARHAHPLLKSIVTELTRRPEITDEIQREARKRMAGMEVRTQRAFPEALAVLEEAGRHASLGVIANQQRGVREVLRRDGLEPLLRAVYISEEAGMMKPDAALFERALRETACCPSEAAMVGDRLDNDVEPAKALGFHTIRVRWGVFRHQQPLTVNQRPDVEVATLGEVPHALERLARRE